MAAEDQEHFSEVHLESLASEDELGEDEYDMMSLSGDEDEHVEQDTQDPEVKVPTAPSEASGQAGWDEAPLKRTQQSSQSRAEDSKLAPRTPDAQDTQWSASSPPTQEPSYTERRDSMVDDNPGALVKYIRKNNPHYSRSYNLDNEATVPDTANFDTSTVLPEAPEPPRPKNVPLASDIPGTSSHFQDGTLPDGPPGVFTVNAEGQYVYSMPDTQVPSAGGTSGPNFAQCPPHPPPPPPSGPSQGPPPLVFDEDASLEEQKHVMQTYLSGLSRRIDDMQKSQFGLASLAVHNTGRAVGEIKQVTSALDLFGAMYRDLDTGMEELGKKVEEMNTRSEEEGIPEMAQKLMSTSVGMSFRMDGLKAKLGEVSNDTLSELSRLTAKNDELKRMGQVLWGSEYELPPALTEATINATRLGAKFETTKASMKNKFLDDDCAQEGDWEPPSTAGGMPAPPAPPSFMGYGSSRGPPGPPPMFEGFPSSGPGWSSDKFPGFPPGVPPPPPPGSENCPPPPPPED